MRGWQLLPQTVPVCLTESQQLVTVAGTHAHAKVPAASLLTVVSPQAWKVSGSPRGLGKVWCVDRVVLLQRLSPWLRGSAANSRALDSVGLGQWT